MIEYDTKIAYKIIEGNPHVLPAKNLNVRNISMNREFKVEFNHHFI